ncbi:putative helical region found in SNAREs [Lyophyllum shimeji]|uniref:Helical region found in SNAREs n=1 Tax=Lyophyllum shimeji TaxID=47721 RepID=A0A9P3UL57_LYOSH|nr:putative helical region found in SNAREs [Lyophyllum shimeji]
MSSSSSAASSSVTTRSRTGLFLSYRESIPRTRNTRYGGDDEEEERLISTPQHVTLDVPLPPKWVDFADQVELILADTQAKITALDKLHAKHLLPGFSDRTQEEREIDALTTDITRDFRQCQTLIQKIGLPQHSFPPSKSASQAHSEALAAKNVQRGLAVKVQDLSAAFRKKQRVYMEKLQGHAIKNQDLLIASGAISLKGSEGISAVDDDVAAAKHTKSQSLSLSQSQSQSLLADSYDQDAINARTHSLNELANSIATLAELFKDLSVLIIDQGTLLDSIEYNIEQTAVRMGEAVEILEEAKGYQGRTGRRRCILLLVLLVMLAATALVIKIRRGRGAKEETHVHPPPPAATATGAPALPVVDVGVRTASGFDPWEHARPRISSRIVPRARWRKYDAHLGEVGDART